MPGLIAEYTINLNGILFDVEFSFFDVAVEADCQCCAEPYDPGHPSKIIMPRLLSVIEIEMIINRIIIDPKCRLAEAIIDKLLSIPFFNWPTCWGCFPAPITELPKGYENIDWRMYKFNGESELVER